MINAFKQIRLTNVNLSGQNDRIAVSNSGELAFVSELDAASGVLANSILSTGSTLDTRITSEVTLLSGALLTTSGDLRGYIDESISGVIDLAPAALDTLNELAAALGDDENFAANLTNTLGNISGSLSSTIQQTGADLQGQIDIINNTYVTLGTTQTISGDKDFTGGVSFSAGFEVNDGAASTATLFVSGDRVGINNESPAEALDVIGNVTIDGNLFVASGIDANNAIIGNVAAPISDADAANLAYVTGVSGALNNLINSNSSELATASGILDAKIDLVSGTLQTDVNTRVVSATQKQFELAVPTGIEILNVSFPGDAFSSTPSVQLTLDGEVSYQTVVRNRSAIGFDAYFSDIILETGTYLNVFASNQ